MRALAALTIGGAVLVIGCATGTDVEDTPGLGGSGGSQDDAAAEAAPPQDAAKEASADAVVDASEAAPETGSDASPDVGPDVSPDVAPDSPPEAAPEAAPDVAPEAADPCSGLVCKTPPVNVCKDADELEVFNANGTCSAGVCIYASQYTVCQHGCSMGQCAADPCIGVTCATPPANTCTNASYLKVFDTPGTCSEGNCSYSSHEEYCTFGCASGTCNGDPCQGKICNTPQANYCSDNTHLVVYSTPGTCANGTCSYANQSQFCAFGCAFGACKNDPCAGVTCNTPTAAYCIDASKLRKYDAIGTCSGGSCTYGSTDVDCPNGCMNGACKDCTTDAQCSAGKWCDNGACTACTVDAHCGTTCSNCLASGQTCQGGTCACATGTKLCGGNCVSTSLPQMGCSNADCTACPLPAFATGTDCTGAGGTCGFTCDASLHRVAQANACVCDAASHWVEVNGACECEQGYVDHSGNCVLNCAGTVVGSSCYWYESAAVTFDAAEAVCVGKGGHLSSIADAAENETVRVLAASNAWIGLRDLQGDKSASEKGDDCTNPMIVDPAGGRYSDSTIDLWDDMGPCGKSTNYGEDAFYKLVVSTQWTWVFTAKSSSFDAYMGLWTVGAGSGGQYVNCLVSNLTCDDDSGPGDYSRIIRTLDPGTYMLVVDSGDSYSGSFTFSARRFIFTDGVTHIYQNWAGEEPNNSSNNEGCAEINSTSGAWNDLNCSTAHPAVCKKPL